jgi:hypothetical protein
MMMRPFFLSLIFVINGSLYAQSFLDLKEIGNRTNDSTSAYFYPTLIYQFKNNPQSFDTTKAKFLYYGKLYSKNYKMFQFTGDDKEFNRLLNKHSYRKAIPFGEKILQEDPANIEVNVKLNLCYNKGDMKEKADTTLIKLTFLLNAVFQSGTGRDKDSGYQVVAIGDEYIVMSWLGLVTLSRQSAMKGSSTIDSWEVKNIKTGQKSTLHFEWLVNLEQGTKNMKWPD